MKRKLSKKTHELWEYGIKKAIDNFIPIISNLSVFIITFLLGTYLGWEKEFIFQISIYITLGNKAILNINIPNKD